MPANTYEGLFIFDSNRYSRDPGGVSGQLTEMVNKCGGTMLASRLWEERRLAYPINGQRKGTYWLTYFRLDTNQLGKLNRESQLNEAILRSLVLKVDPRIAEALVSHAQGTGQAAPATDGERRRAEQPAAVAADAKPETAGT